MTGARALNVRRARYTRGEHLPGGAVPPCLPISSLTNRWAATDADFRHDAMRIALIAALHLAALALMAWSEVAIVPKIIFLLTWGMLNLFWLALLQRPAVSAALSLLMIVVLILLSRLKYDVILTTANFLDVWIIDDDTVSFLLMVIPGVTQKLVTAAALTVPVLGLLWWLDRFRVRLRTAAIGLVACLAGITALSLAFPQDDSEAFFGDSYVSKFSRSGIAAIPALMMHGYMESDAVVTDHLKMLPDATCTPTGKPRTSSWCTMSRASTSESRPASRLPRTTVLISCPSTAGSGISSSKAPAGRVG